MGISLLFLDLLRALRKVVLLAKLTDSSFIHFSAHEKGRSVCHSAFRHHSYRVSQRYAHTPGISTPPSPATDNKPLACNAVAPRAVAVAAPVDAHVATGSAGEVKGCRGGSRHAAAAESDSDGSEGGSRGGSEGGATGAAAAAG